MIFEPDAPTVLEALLPLYVNREVYQHALDAKASEHSARMVAMKTAKDNAITNAAQDVGQAAQDVGNAAQEAAKNTK